jgi:hypothetical protein
MTGDCTLAWLKSFSWAFAVAQPNANRAAKIAVFVIVDEYLIVVIGCCKYK